MSCGDPHYPGVASGNVVESSSHTKYIISPRAVTITLLVPAPETLAPLHASSAPAPPHASSAWPRRRAPSPVLGPDSCPGQPPRDGAGHRHLETRIAIPLPYGLPYPTAHPFSGICCKLKRPELAVPASLKQWQYILSGPFLDMNSNWRAPVPTQRPLSNWQTPAGLPTSRL